VDVTTSSPFARFRRRRGTTPSRVPLAARLHDDPSVPHRCPGAKTVAARSAVVRCAAHPARGESTRAIVRGEREFAVHALCIRPRTTTLASCG